MSAMMAAWSSNLIDCACHPFGLFISLKSVIKITDMPGKRRRKTCFTASKGKRKKTNWSDEDNADSQSSINSSKNDGQSAHSTELYRKDLISTMNVRDDHQFADDEITEIADNWKCLWNQAVQVPNSIDKLRRPTNIIELRKRNKTSSFHRPKKLFHYLNSSFDKEVHFAITTHVYEKGVCQYYMNNADYHWLMNFNHLREDHGIRPLDEYVFEEIMEEFEIQAFENIQNTVNSEGLGTEYDEDAVCDVCRSPDSLDGNEMVFCDHCNVCVHQVCYGIAKIPKGSWICHTCVLDIGPPCILCPNKGGAMKLTRSQSWAHVSCAVWIPELSFQDFIKMEPIVGTSKIPENRWSLTCSLCKKKNGVCITCSEKGCKTSFHVTCAFNEGLQMRATVKNNFTDEDSLKAFCRKHSKKQSAKFSDSEEDVSAVMHVRKNAQTREKVRQLKIQEKEKEFYNFVNIENVVEKFNNLDLEEVITIFNYWKMKRKQNFNQALVIPKIDQEDHCYAFRNKMIHLREDLERVRNLSYMVQKREESYRKWLKIKNETFSKQLDILENENRNLSAEERQAVLNANDGSLAEDKAYAFKNQYSPVLQDVLTVLQGKDAAKRQVNNNNNASLKSSSSKKKYNKKSDDNPYAKPYLNGLEKRVQRFFPTTSKQKSEDKQNFNFENAAFDEVNNINPQMKDEIDYNFHVEVKHDISGDISSNFNDISDDNKDNTWISSQCSNDSETSLPLNSTSEQEGLEICHIKPNIIMESECMKFETTNLGKLSIRESKDFISTVTSSEFKLNAESSHLLSDTLKNSEKRCKSLSTSVSYRKRKISGGSTKNQSSIKKRKLDNVRTTKSTGLSSEKCDIDMWSESTSMHVESHCVATKKELNFEGEKDGSVFSSTFEDKNGETNSAEQNWNSDDEQNSNDSKIIDVNNIAIESCLQTSLDLELQLKHNKISLPQPYVILKSKDIVNCNKSKNIILSDEEFPKKSSDKFSDEPMSEKSNGNICGKSEAKFRPVINNNSSVRTQSPTSVKGENETLKSRKLSPKHSSQDASINIKSSTSKQKDLSSSTIIAPPSLVNKHDTKKIRSGKPEENSLDSKRGSSPLSPLPDISSSNVKSYHSNAKSSWRKLEPRSEKAASKKPWTPNNGDNQAQASRLVFPSNHEPEIPRWPMDPNQAWGMTQMLHPPLPPPPVPPFRPPWIPMPHQNGFPPMMMNFRPGLYNT
ncbi:protein Jade-1 [Caerostris darwini]|uniref:PHD finger protein rhinoceros n=1 Tax=Caerostris darwini TaxID=1538125 RepID=A0AAV4VPJ3_9ARAC|nr:protein Jade-1 [Caerostris darwini]